MEYSNYERLRKRVLDFSTFTPSEYMDRLTRVTNFRSQLIDVWSKLKTEIVDLDIDIDEKKKEVFEKIKKQSNLYENKYEIDMMVNGDSNLIKLRRRFG